MSNDSTLITPPPIVFEESPASPACVGRRSVRLPVEIPIIAKGTTISGRPFSENVWTVSINKHGARLAMVRHLAVGTELVLENPALHRSAKARVIHLREKKFPEVHYEIGVELLEPQNIWGVEFPSTDGQPIVSTVTVPEVVQSPSEGAPPAPDTAPEVPADPTAMEEAAALAIKRLTQRDDRVEEPVEFGLAGAESSTVADPGSQLETGFLEADARPEGKESAEQAEAGQGLRPAEQIGEAELFKPYNYPEHPSKRAARAAAEEVKKRLREEMRAASSTMVEEMRRRLQQVSSAALEASSDEAATRLAALNAENLSRSVAELQVQQTQAVERTKEQLSQIVESTESSRRQLEGLLAKIEEVRRVYQEEANKKQSQAGPSSPAAVRPSPEELKKWLREELQGASSGMAEEVRKRLEEVSTAALQASSNAAAARLAALAEESLSRSVAELEARQAQAVEQAKESLSQIVETTETPRRELEALLARIEEVHQLNQAALETKPSPPDQGGGTAKFKVYQYTEPITWQAPPQGSEGLEKPVPEEAEAASSGVVDEVRKRLQEASSAAVETSSREAEARLAALTEENLSRWASELQAQTIKAAEHAKDQMSQIVEATAASLRGRTEQAAATMASSLSQHLAKLTQESVERAYAVSQNATRLIEGRGQEIRQRIEAEIAGAAAETQKRLEQSVSQRLDAALASLNDAACEAKAASEIALETLETNASSGRAAEGFQKLSQTVYEEFQRKTDAGYNSVVSKLDLSLRQFREEKGPAYFAELERATDTLLNSSALRLQDQANETLEVVRAQLQVAAKALEEESKERLASAREPQLDSFSQDARAIVEGYRSQLETLLGTSQQQTDGLAASARKLLEETENRLSAAARTASEAIEAHARNATESSQALSQLTTSARTTLEDAEKQCVARAESALANLNREAQAREMMAGQLAAQARSVVEDAEMQLGAAAHTSLESLKTEARTAVEGCRAEFPKLLQEFRDRGCQDLELHFQEIVERQRETWSAQLRKETEESGQRALAELRNQVALVSSEAADAVHKQVGRAAFVLKDWADQASARLETAFQHSLEAFQKQIAEASAAALEKHRQDSAAFFEGVQNLLNEASRIFRQKPGG